MSRSKVKVSWTKKNEKVRHFVRESSSGARTSCGIPFGSGPRERGPPAVLRRWENQRMVSSYELGTYMTTGDLEQDLRSHIGDSRYSSLSMMYDCCNMTRSIFEILDERFSSAEMTFKCYSRSSIMSLLETPFLLTFYCNFLPILYLFWDSKKFVEDRDFNSCLCSTLRSRKIRKVGWLEFNVPFQHKYGYIRDEENP